MTVQSRPLSEEFASAAIQGSAAAASGVGLAYLVTRTAPRHDAATLAAVIVYGASMTIAFLASALYHGVQHPRIKPVLQRIDHCTIFLFIAGTYTQSASATLTGTSRVEKFVSRYAKWSSLEADERERLDGAIRARPLTIHAWEVAHGRTPLSETMETLRFLRRTSGEIADAALDVFAS